MFLTRKSVLAAIVVAALAVGLVAAFAGKSSATGASRSGAASAGPSNNFGFSKTVQAKVDRLNAQLDRCLLASGAERVPLGNGWTYTDPGGRPSAACAGVQARVNAYADSAEYRQAVAAVLPAAQAYSACLQREGAPPASHGASTAAERAALTNAVVACGGRAADAVAAG